MLLQQLVYMYIPRAYSSSSILSEARPPLNWYMYVNTPSSVSPHLLELSLTDTITIEDDPVGLEAGALVEVDEHLSHHGGQL